MERICEDGGFFVRGKYFLYNNLWGAATGSGSQCVWEGASDGPGVAWETGWDWAGRGDTIKSYAAAVLGWHGGWRVPGTGLPVRLASIRSAPTSWAFDLIHETPGKTNVTYDIWLSDRPDHDKEDPTGEVMIWIHHTEDIRPIGSMRRTTTIDGTEWDLWAGPHPESGWPVFSFVRRANTCVEELDLASFFELLAPEGLSRSDYLLGIEAGVEVYDGRGRLNTTLYSVDIERG